MLSFDAVTLLVPDYDAALAYVVGTLGLTLVEDTPLADGKRWVLVAAPGGGSRILLARAVGDGQMETIGRQGGGRVFLFLGSDDFAADHALLVAAGVDFVEPPRSEPYGKVAVFVDPFGNRWDLVERRP